MTITPRSRFAAPGMFLAVVVVTGVLALGLHAVPLAMAGAVVPWGWWLARRFRIEVAGALLVLALLWLLTLSLVATGAMGSSVLWSTAPVVVSGLVGVVVMWKSAPGPGPIRSIAPVIGSLVGPALWTVFQLASQVLPPYERLSWLMRNDSLNNLILARDVLGQGGIVLGGLENPAPLPAAVIAVFLAVGREGLPSARLLEHDLTSMGLAWGILIALTCFLAGQVAMVMVRRASAGIAPQVFASVLGSIALLCWYGTGAAMENGFINTHISLIVLFCIVLIAVADDLPAAVRIPALAVGGTVMLAVWSPLAAVPLAVLALAVVAERRDLLGLPTRSRIVVALSLVQLMAWGVGVTLVVLLGQREALAGAGGIFRSQWWIVFLVGAAVVAVDAAVSRRGSATRRLVLPAVVLAAFTGIALLLFVSRRAPDPWTYYPVKFAWFVTLFLGVMLLGLLVGWATRWPTRESVRRALLAVIAAAVAALLVWTPDITPNLAMNPLDRLVRAQTLERVQQLHKAILAHPDPEDPVLYWATGEWWEPDADLWVISLKADTLARDSELRNAAYASYSDRSIDKLCTLIPLMGSPLTIITASPLLSGEIDDTCGPTAVTVVLL